MKLKVKEEFTLKEFNKLENIERANLSRNEEGHLYIGDTFDCDEEMFKYLDGDNKYNRSYVSIVKEHKKEENEIKSEVKKQSTPKKKKTSKK